MLVFGLSYYYLCFILLHFIFIYYNPFEACLCSKVRQRVGGCEEKLGERDGEETVFRIYYIKKKSTFNKMKKLQDNIRGKEI